MFHVGTYAQLLLCLCVVQPVLSLNVVRLLFFGVENRIQQTDLAVLAEVACQSGCGEERAENVALFSVEVHLKGSYVLHRTKRGLAVRGLEVVVVLRDVADNIQRPPLVGLVGDVGLIVQEVRSVFAFSLQRAQQIACRLIAQSMRHGEFWCWLFSL